MVKIAPVFRHGKGFGVYANQYNLGRVVTDSQSGWSCDTADTTVYGDNDRSFQAGLRNGSMSLNGFVDASPSSLIAELRDQWAALEGSTTPAVISWGDFSAVNGKVRLVLGHVTQADVSAPTADMAKASMACQPDGGVRTGALIRLLAQRTTTGASAQYDWKGSASTQSLGVVGHLHVTATSGVTTATIKVQHSSSGASWADVLTFANSTGPKGNRQTAAGVTLKRYVRETLSSLAGSSPKITYAVSFSRPQ